MHLKNSWYHLALGMGLGVGAGLVFATVSANTVRADATYIGQATKGAAASGGSRQSSGGTEELQTSMSEALQTLRTGGSLNAQQCSSQEGARACDKWGYSAAQASANQMGFENFQSGVLAHCWAMSIVERALRAGAIFAPTAVGSENVTQKLERLLKGEPQTFTSVGSMRELTKKYEGQIKKFLESLQRKRFYRPSNLGFALKDSKKADNSKSLQEIKKLLDLGSQPLIVLNAGLTMQHVVTVIGISGSTLKVVDSNFPNTVPREVVCTGGSCQFAFASGFPANQVAVTVLKDGDLKVANKLASARGCAKLGG